ncbi:MAG: glycosyltransferase [Thermoanaerobaculia bacterium]
MGAGGLERVVASIARRTDKALFRHWIIVLHLCDMEYMRRLKADGVEVVFLQSNSVSRASRARKLCRLAAYLKPDVVHGHSGAFMDAYVMALLTRKRPRLLLTSHGYPVDSGVRELIRVGLPTLPAQAHVCVSEDLAEFFRRRYRFLPSAQRVITILNGVDTKIYRPRPKPRVLPSVSAQALEDLQESFVIGSVGRLEPVKNHQYLLQAFAALVGKTDRPCRLVLVGTGSLRARLEKMIREMGIDELVQFLGVRDDIPQILNLFDAFALTSLSEGSSISLLEAQASGVPAFVTDVGGNDRIVIDGSTGYLCPLDNPSIMAERLAMIVEKPEHHRVLSKKARQMALQSFDLDTMVRQYESLYLGKAAA